MRCSGAQRQCSQSLQALRSSSAWPIRHGAPPTGSRCSDRSRLPAILRRLVFSLNPDGGKFYAVMMVRFGSRRCGHLYACWYLIIEPGVRPAAATCIAASCAPYRSRPHATPTSADGVGQAHGCLHPGANAASAQSQRSYWIRIREAAQRRARCTTRGGRRQSSAHLVAACSMQSRHAYVSPVEAARCAPPSAGTHSTRWALSATGAGADRQTR